MKITRCIAVSVMVWLCSPGVAADLRRIHSDINDSETFRLAGNTRPAVVHGLAVDRGQVPGWQPMPRMSLHFSMTDAQRADLNQLLAAQQNRRSPQYRKFLTPEQYAARFGLHPADMAKVTGWLENNGFANVRSARGGTSVSFSGTAAGADRISYPAHGCELKGESYTANVSEPELPKALSRLVKSIGGLHNFRLKPHARFSPHFSSPYPNYFTAMAPDDWATIYNVKPLYGTGLGAPPYAFAITNGALPLGLTRDPFFGTIQGTATYAGTSHLTASVTDTGFPPQTATATGSFVVDPTPAESGTVTVTATSGGIVNTITIPVTVTAADGSPNSVKPAFLCRF